MNHIKHTMRRERERENERERDLFITNEISKEREINTIQQI